MSYTYIAVHLNFWPMSTWPRNKKPDPAPTTEPEPPHPSSGHQGPQSDKYIFVDQHRNFYLFSNLVNSIITAYAFSMRIRIFFLNSKILVSNFPIWVDVT